MSSRRPASLATLAARVKEGEAAPSEVVRATVDWIERVDPAVRAWVEVRSEQALAEARALDREVRRSDPPPLAGIPLGVKDVIDVRGLPSRAGRRGGAPAPAAQDAASAAVLRRAGAIIVGKTVTHELAYGVHSPPTANPWDLSRGPGGSSGGSAAAVATATAAVALGTDTAGSVRIPAALCGVVGFKPTHGRVPTHGVLPLSWSLDHVGWMVRNARDLEHLDRVLGLPPPRDTPAWPRGLRIGRCEALDGGPTHPRIGNLLEQTLDALVAQGASVRDVSVELAEAARAAHGLIMRAEATARHRRFVAADPEAVGPVTRGLLALGEAVSAPAYLDAQRVRALFTAQMDAVFADVDVLLCPATLVEAQPADTVTVEVAGHEVAYAAALIEPCIAASLSGCPAVSVPVGCDDGPPVGVQLIARRGDDAALVRMAAAVQDLVPPPGLPPACPEGLPDVLAE